jgi:hypothetical protein
MDAGGGASGVACGMTTCAGATPVCCVAPRGGAETCAATVSDCVTDAGRPEVALTCLGAASCPTAGDVCCVRMVRVDGGRTDTVTECAARCMVGTQVCTTDSDCPANEICPRAGMAAYDLCMPGVRPRDAGAPDAARMRDGGRGPRDAAAD